MLYWALGTNTGVGIGVKSVEVGPGAGLKVGAGVDMVVGVGPDTDIVVGVVGSRHVSVQRTSSLSCLFSAVKLKGCQEYFGLFLYIYDETIGHVIS